MQQSSYIVRTYFDHAALGSPEAGTSLEYLQVAAKGAYAAAAICGCNTRKYHGLLVAPQPQIDDDNHVLLSALDETIISEGNAWQLSTHRYTGVYYPEGYNHIREFFASPIPQWTYEAGNAVLRKELLFAGRENTLMIRYTLVEAPAAITLRLLPLLAFRNIHTLNRVNEHVNRNVTQLPGGIAVSLYAAYAPLYLQLSGAALYIPAPDWFYHMEYLEEQKRGYDFHEDLYTPGYFEIQLDKGESVIVAAGLEEGRPVTYETVFNRVLAGKTAPYSMHEHLLNAARQFIVDSNPGTVIKAGYYWFGPWGRDTCIALPGLTLITGDVLHFRKIIDTLLAGLKDGLLPNTGTGEHAVYNTVDASLWLVWALQQFVHYYDSATTVWREYGVYMKSILHHYRQGTHYGIRMEEDGLIFAGKDGYALTWMDVIVDKQPVTPRTGKAVEVNALWYNAICFCLQLANEAGDEDFVKEWEQYPAQIRNAFVRCFWDPAKQYLADCVNVAYKDWSVRPNQLFAVSLPFSPLTAELQAAVMNKVTGELLTPKGLRTLSPEDDRYCGHYSGDQRTRDLAYHQGTVWPWLLGHFAAAYLKVYEEAALPLLEKIYAGMAPVLQEYCLYSIAEVYDGDYPYKAGGAVAQAWSVAELLRFNDLVNEYKQQLISNRIPQTIDK